MRASVRPLSQALKSALGKLAKSTDNKLQIQIDHDGGTVFTPTATLVFDNVTVDTTDRLLVNSLFIAHNNGNLTLSNLIDHLRIEGQLFLL